MPEAGRESEPTRSGAPPAGGAGVAPSSQGTVEVLVGVWGQAGPQAEEAARKVEERLAGALPGRAARVVPLAPSSGAPAGLPSVSAGGYAGAQSALLDLLRIGAEAGAPACALLSAEEHEEGVDWPKLLLGPVIEDGYDFACASYRRNKLDGAINTGIVYPLTRALFGRRLRQPLGGELAVSRRLAEGLREDEEWRTDPAHAGGDIWLVAKVMSREYKVCQSFLGRRPRHAAEGQTDVGATLAQVVGLLFHEIRRNAAAWQRVRGSTPVPTFGDASPLDEETPQVNVSRLLSTFELGHNDLRDVWGTALPPATLLQLKRFAALPAQTFRMEDALWARILYDFAVGHHLRVMDRRQLLLSLLPLYLGWLASFVNQVRGLGPADAEQRVEALCQAFEREKPYLISRWRWPDRWNP